MASPHFEASAIYVPNSQNLFAQSAIRKLSKSTVQIKRFKFKALLSIYIAKEVGKNVR